MPVLAVEILRRLLAHTSLASSLQFSHIQRFLELTRRIWPEIVGRKGILPVALPAAPAAFLSAALNLPPETVTLSWVAFSDIAQRLYEDPAEPPLDDAFRLHGMDYHIGAEYLGPPIHQCSRPSCNQKQLSDPVTVEARLFTLHRGVLPVFSNSLYCRGCHTRYYPNYFVKDASNADEATREYYKSEIPNYIHVTESTFVEKQLCVHFEMQMAMTHSSSQGIATIYNLALGTSAVPHSSRLSHQLDGEMVFDCFLHHAILRDKSTRHEILCVPHGGPQRHRLDQVLAQRNYLIMGTGQEMWAHACDRCMKVYKGDDGNWYIMTAGVHDGVSVQHLKCRIHDCKEPLPSQKSRFCQPHNQLRFACYIDGCSNAIQTGFSTCTIASHRAHELAALEHHKAMFQLHSRLQNAGISQVPQAGSSTPVPTSTSNSASNSGPTPATSSTSSGQTSTPEVKGSNSRSYTHNEQLFVRCCGVIISRATFFGSEGITGVSLFLKATFPEQYPGALPSYIFYDNNCQFQKHLNASGDHYFDRVGLPVDVWHFECKHKEGDTFCQTHCNPARFRELIGADGEWVFNSSAAEQANVWFGKFQNIVREMSAIRYNFFLDEMIAIHNQYIVSQLQQKGERPHMLPDEILCGTSMV